MDDFPGFGTPIDDTEEFLNTLKTLAEWMYKNHFVNLYVEDERFTVSPLDISYPGKAYTFKGTAGNNGAIYIDECTGNVIITPGERKGWNEFPVIKVKCW